MVSEAVGEGGFDFDFDFGRSALDPRLCGGEDGLEYLGVAGTAAQVALEPVADVLFGGVGVLAEEGGGVDQEAGNADPALEGGLVDERLLEAAELAGPGQALDGGQ